METITFEQFQNLELKVGKIISVDDIPGADKLYKIQISLGNKETQVVAGIKPYYTKEELIFKKVAMIVNLEPKIIRGIESRGMILAATSPDGRKVVLITPEKDIEEGAIIK